MLIGGIRYPARIYVEKGQSYKMEGGAVQKRTLNAIVLCSLLPASRINETDGTTRGLEVTHLETGIRYRIDTGGVNQSPYGVYWEIDCSQPTAQ